MGKRPYALVAVGDGKVFVDTYDRHDGELIWGKGRVAKMTAL